MLKKFKKTRLKINQQDFKRPQFLVFVLGFALIGTYLLFQSLAAVNFLKVEAEVVAPIGNATRVAAANASGTGNNVVQFGAASSTVPILYQAEDAAHDPNSIVETKSSGTVLGSFGHQGQFVTFTVRVDNTGDYAASLRYAAADGTATKLDPLPRTLLINNVQVRTINFPRTSSGSDQWDTLTTKSIDTLHLTGGTPNTVTFRIDTTQEGYWDVDYLEVAGASGTTPPPTCPAGTHGTPPDNCVPDTTTGETCDNFTYGLPCIGPVSNLPNRVSVSTADQFVSAINSAVAGTNIVLTADINLNAYQVTDVDGEGWDGVYFNDKNGQSNAYIRITGDPTMPRPKITGGIHFLRSSFVELRHLDLSIPTGDSRYNQYQTGISFQDGSHDVRAYDNHIHDLPSCGLCAQGTIPGAEGGAYVAHLDFRYNLIERVARRDQYGPPALSIYKKGALPGDNFSDVKNLIIGNVISDIRRDNYSDGFHGGCIFFDKGYEPTGVTIVASNICAGIDGRGFGVKNFGNVRLLNNTFYETAALIGNVQLEFCHGHDMSVIGNAVIGSKGQYLNNSGSYCNLDGEVAGVADRNIIFANNAWQAPGAQAIGNGDVIVPQGTPALSSPQIQIPLNLNLFRPQAILRVNGLDDFEIGADRRPRNSNYAGALEP